MKLYISLMVMLWIIIGLPVRAEVGAAAGIVDRLAVGILTWKLADANGRWWECGVQVADPTTYARAWADAIVQAAGADLNPWGMAGVIANESKFDACAIGRKTREWAYQTGLLRPSRLTLSHTQADVMRVVRHRARKAVNPNVDLGPGQIMYGMVYKGTLEDLLSVTPGVAIMAAEMRRRMVIIGVYNGKALRCPWGTWPGSYNEKYDRWIVTLARRLGATEADIESCGK